MASLRALIAGLTFFVLSSCTQSPTGPEATASKYLESLASRDGDRLMALLDPATRQQIEGLYEQAVNTRELIRQSYPEADRAAAERATGVDLLAGLDSPEALFRSLLEKAGTPSSLGKLQRFGLRAKSSTQDDEATVITTWGGDKVRLVPVEGGWAVTLDNEQEARLQALLAVTRANLHRVTREIETHFSRRFGTPTP